MANKQVKKGKQTIQRVPVLFKVLPILVAIGSACAIIWLVGENPVLSLAAAFVFGLSLLVLRNVIKAERELKEKAKKAQEKKNRKKK